MKLSKELVIRAWSKIDVVEDPNACWECNCCKSQGYGKIRFNGKTYHLHRVIWTIVNGPIPEGLLVCHTCDNPACNNPKHLFLGTNWDNIKDMSQKGRGRGGGGVLTKGQIKAIPQLYAIGMSPYKIAQLFGCSHVNIRYHLSRK